MDVITLAQELIRSPSVTPDDAGCQDKIARLLQQHGFSVHRLTFGNVSNLYARYGQQGTHFCFAGHSDVVPVGQLEQWQHPPFAATIDQGRLYGRGACDMKGPLAAMITAAIHFLQESTHFQHSISFLITGDEEGEAINGTVRVLEWLQNRQEIPDYCLLGEPTCSQHLGDCIKNGRRGSLHGKIIFTGKQGHVAYPQLAINPIHMALPCLTKLSQLQLDQGGDGFPPSSLQLTEVTSGGIASNVIPSQLKASFNIRFGVHSNQESMTTAIRALMDSFAIPPYQLDFELGALPFVTTPGQLYHHLAQAIADITHLQPQLATTGGTSDARFIAHYCPETLEFGFLADSMHQINESCAIEDLIQLETIYRHLLHLSF